MSTSDPELSLPQFPIPFLLFGLMTFVSSPIKATSAWISCLWATNTQVWPDNCCGVPLKAGMNSWEFPFRDLPEPRLDTDKISALAAHVLQVEWIQPSGFHRFQELQEDWIIQGQRDLCGIPLKVHLPEDKCFFLFFTHWDQTEASLPLYHSSLALHPSIFLIKT